MKSHADRRKHKRFPVLYALAKPVRLRRAAVREAEPAVMANLSAGGMALVTFKTYPKGTALTLDFDLGVVKAQNLSGVVKRCEDKGGLFTLGIAFTQIPEETRKTIHKMADDFDRCETRMMLGEPLCERGCAYRDHCTKSIRGKYD